MAEDCVEKAEKAASQAKGELQHGRQGSQKASREKVLLANEIRADRALIADLKVGVAWVRLFAWWENAAE